MIEGFKGTTMSESVEEMRCKEAVIPGYQITYSYSGT